MAKFIIIDDAKFMRNILSDILKNADHEVAGEGETGKDAIRLFRELEPDVAIMDITMPQMSGLNAIKEIKAEFPNAKIIMCSAIGQQKIVMEAIKAGAKDFIVKPFVEERVIDSISRVLH